MDLKFGHSVLRKKDLMDEVAEGAYGGLTRGTRSISDLVMSFDVGPPLDFRVLDPCSGTRLSNYELLSGLGPSWIWAYIWL